MGMKGAPARSAASSTASLALGWRGANRHWQHYERAYLILAALSTPLVLSVHSVVSFDFATSVMPGWHTTIFPPYFVAGAVFSGFAMVMTLMLITRAVYGMQELITIKHLELMNKIMLVTGSLVGYAYAMEFFIACVLGQPVRAVRLLEPRLRPLRVGVLDDDQLQRHLAAALLVEEAPHEHPRDVRGRRSSSTSACGSSASSSS